MSSIFGQLPDMVENLLIISASFLFALKFEKNLLNFLDNNNITDNKEKYAILSMMFITLLTFGVYKGLFYIKSRVITSRGLKKDNVFIDAISGTITTITLFLLFVGITLFLMRMK